MKRIKKLFAMIAIAFLLVPVSVMVLPTSGDHAFGGPCYQCVPDNGGMICAWGFAEGYDYCYNQAGNDNCWLDSPCGEFE